MPASNYEAVTKRRIVEYVKANPRKSGSAIARELGLISRRVNQFLYYESKAWGLVGLPVIGATYKVWVHEYEQRLTVPQRVMVDPPATRYPSRPTPEQIKAAEEQAAWEAEVERQRRVAAERAAAKAQAEAVDAERRAAEAARREAEAALAERLQRQREEERRKAERLERERKAQREIEEQVKRSRAWLERLTIAELEALFAKSDYELTYNDSEKAAMAERLQQLRAVRQTKREEAAQANGIWTGVATWFLVAFMLVFGSGNNEQMRGLGLLMACPIGWAGCAVAAKSAGSINRKRLAGN